MKRLLYGLAAAALLLSPLRSPAGYLVTDLGRFATGGLNNSGQVGGFSSTGTGPYYAVLYGGGRITDLGTLGGAQSFANGINDSGQVVGESETASGYTHAFLYGGGTMTDLGTLPGGSYSFAYGVNASGQVVGQSTPRGGAGHAFLYGGGKMTDLGTLPGDSESIAYGVNASGQVVGSSFTSSGVPHAFLYGGGVMKDLGGLGGPTTEARAINASGQVVGYSTLAAPAINTQHAFLYGGGKMTDLGTLNGPGGFSYATAINGSGQVVGYSAAGSQTHAFLYDGSLHDLNGLLPAGSGLTLTGAYGINDKGQIAAQGSDDHGYLLTPDGVAAAPEPSALVLLALGGAGLLTRARRRAGAPAAG
jgi:probable HAF family extracellular repeat protein